MSLEAQVSLIDSPQEFMRLCNACLNAEHGDDFLPIADDRADRGNDGYLKSERRLFAAHCFRRIQNQGVEAEIRKKATSDLAKAVSLKAAGPWEIDAWTFICNYPMPETIASALVEFGAAAEIDVAWRDSEYLATALYRHKHLSASFPALQIPQVDARLDELAAKLDLLGASSVQTVEELPDDHIPRSPAQSQRLIQEQPVGWEYSLFAGEIVQGRDRLKAAWEDFERGLTREKFQRFDVEEAATFLSHKCGEAASMVGAADAIFEEGSQLRAFGAPGESGDPVLIEHFASWVCSLYERFMAWTAEVRAVEMPEELDEVQLLTARLLDRPLRQWREFASAVETEFAKIPAHVANDDGSKLELHLTMSMDIEDGLTERLSVALRDVESRLGS